MRGKSFLLFLATASGVIAVLIFMVAPSHAQAYAVTPTTSSGFDTNYNFGGSFQNLISPFQNFVKGVQWNTSTNINVRPAGSTAPMINITPDLQNFFAPVDNWFYGLTGFRLSSIVVIILTGLSWALGIAKAIVDWLLGLFHL